MLNPSFINYKNKLLPLNNKIKRKFSLFNHLKNKFSPNRENLVFKYKFSKIKNLLNNSKIVWYHLVIMDSQANKKNKKSISNVHQDQFPLNS